MSLSMPSDNNNTKQALKIVNKLVNNILYQDQTSLVPIKSVKCNTCQITEIRGYCYKCIICPDYALCGVCFERRSFNSTHKINHPMVRLDRTDEQLNLNKISLKDLSEQFANKIHFNLTCDSCSSTPIKGLSFICDVCDDYDQCFDCYKKNRTSKTHSNRHPLVFLFQEKSFQIDSNQIRLGKVLDSGSFGTVYKARLMHTNQIVACKVVTIRKSDLVRPSFVDLKPKQLMKSYIREVNCYKRLQGVNILKFIGHCVNPIDEGLELMIITEYMGKGSLAKVLDSETELPYRRRLEIATGIISGLARLHELNFIHADLRLDNILIDEDFLPKIGDMGLTIQENCKRYVIPEYFFGEKVTDKLDIFSFGLLLTELFKGEYYINDLKRQVNVTQKPVVFSSLIDQCLDRDATKRPSARCIENYLNLFTDLIDNFIFKILKKYVFMGKVEKDETFVEIHDLIVKNLKDKLMFPEHFSTACKDEKKNVKPNIGCSIS